MILGSDPILSSFVAAVSPWYMPMLFVLAGISAKYSLKKRSIRQFARERVQKLMIPFIIGIAAVMPVMAFFADKANYGYRGSFFGHYSIFYSRWTDLTGYDGGFGVGHLWFLLYLFVISMAALGLDLLFKHMRTRSHQTNHGVGKNTGYMHNLFVIVLLFISMAAAPVTLAGKSILSYLMFYEIGYYCLSQENAVDSLQKYRHAYLILWILSTFLDVYLFIWMPLGEKAIHIPSMEYCFIQYSQLNTAFLYLSGCFGILSLLAYGKRMLDRAGRVTAALSADSFFIYILHFPWVVICEYGFSFVIADTYILFAVSVLCAFLFTLFSCRIIRICAVK